ncbi:MAG: FAD-dependent oxidoreductase [Saprospiraceae bacterium]
MQVAIIGNGISGITAARWIRKLSNNDITIISSETEHFFSRTALMYIYMGHMRYEDTKPYEDWFWNKNRINLLKAHVNSIDFKSKKLLLDNGNGLTYDILIIATGSKSNMFGWPGQNLDAVAGLYSFQDLENMEKYSEGLKRAVIVGGGLIGLEMAEMFHSRHIPVSMIVRESNYWDNIMPQEEATMISNHIKAHGIDLRLQSNLQEIIDDGNGKACGIIVKETSDRIDCGYVGLTAGVSPNVTFLKNNDLAVERGVVVNEYLETNIADVYAIGDCSQHSNPAPGRRPIEAVWYTGRMMGETVAHTICDTKTKYEPGIWFNSAKFLDIEYQVYGQAPKEMPDGMSTLIWIHDDVKKSIRLNFDTTSKTILGFNLMGVRYRHEVCNQWLADGIHIEKMLPQLALANFDPEFYNCYEKEVIAIYNQENGTSISLQSKRGLNDVLAFLKNKIIA